MRGAGRRNAAKRSLLRSQKSVADAALDRSQVKLQPVVFSGYEISKNFRVGFRVGFCGILCCFIGG